MEDNISIETFLKELGGEVYETRLVVMLETDPQSNYYRQVLLTQEQFQKFSRFMQSMMKPEENNSFAIPVGGFSLARITDKIRTYYTVPEINKEIQGETSYPQ